MKIIRTISYSLLLLLSMQASWATKKSPYEAARQGDLDTLRQYRFEGNDLFFPNKQGFTPYEIAALHADPDKPEGLRKQVEVMLWLKEFKPEKHRYGKSTITLIQAGLNALGYPVGSPDGRLGKRTISAIRHYQRDNRLAETGRPGPQWLGIFYQDILKDTQFKLTQLGFDTKGTDGLMGKNTHNAILAYQGNKKDSMPEEDIYLNAKLLANITRDYDRAVKRKEEKIAKAAREAQNKQLRFAQAGLRTLGYRIGKIDGVLGSKTTNAIKSFQKKYRLSVTGKIDNKTQSKMNTVFLKETQRKLNGLGYRAGKPDGQLGKKTQKALSKYQKKKKLKTQTNRTGLSAILIAAIDDSYDNRRVVTRKKTTKKRQKTRKVTKAKKSTKNIAKRTSKKSTSKDVVRQSAAFKTTAVAKPSNRKTAKKRYAKAAKRVHSTGSKGRMVFRRSGGRVVGCSLAGRNIPIEWCEPFYPLPKKNHCEATFKPSTGAVINLWCK